MSPRYIIGHSYIWRFLTGGVTQFPFQQTPDVRLAVTGFRGGRAA